MDLSALPERFTNSLGIEMVLIPGGAFEMGRDLDFGPGVGQHDGPRHPVEVSPFYMSRIEVTKAQYRAYVDATGRDRLPELDPANVGREHRWAYDMAPADDRPIYAAPWGPCKRFCSWLAKREGVGYRLPTEAEWEYAARAGTDTHWWWGEEPLSGSYRHRSMGQGQLAYLDGTNPAGAFPANPWGLYDVYGNASEWCEDWLDPDYYRTGPRKDPPGPRFDVGSGRKIQRGGWFLATSDAQNSYFRMGAPANVPIGGIRLVLPIRAGFELPSTARLPEAVPEAPETIEIERELESYVVELAEGVTVEFLRVEPGEFVLGSPESETGRSVIEGPQTQVRIERPYYLSRYEVTERQWAIISDQPTSGIEGGPDLPAHGVSWEKLYRSLLVFTDKHRAAGALSATEEYRLPYEYEWEYACRAGSRSRFAHGDSERELPWYAYYDQTHGPVAVGERLPNAWGFHDMCGNVWEWTLNRYYEYPGGLIVGQDLKRSGLTAFSVVRGGGWNFGAVSCRPAMRQLFHGGFGFPWVGFRLVRTIDPE